MNRREVPIDVWRKRILDKTEFSANGVIITVVPDIYPGDMDLRLLPDAVFEACTRFVIDFFGRPAKREAFNLFYSAKLEEHEAARVNSGIHSAEADRKRIQELSGLSPDQEINFREEIENKTLQLLGLKTKVTNLHEAIKARVASDPEFEKIFKECEKAYSELLILAVKPEEGDQPLDLLEIIDLVHELIVLNMHKYKLPPNPSRF